MDVVSLSAANAARREAAESLGLARRVTFVDLVRPVGDQLTFVKDAANPLLTTADTDLPSILWPWYFPAGEYLSNPLGAHYFYFSTDHAGSGGRIALAYCDEIGDPLTYHGAIYQDTVSGNETETPSVVWDEANGEPVLYYQQNGVTGTQASQVTMYATLDAATGTVATRQGVALDVPLASGWPAPSHTGYFRPFRVGEGYAAYSLLRGQSSPDFGLSFSRDGRSWQLDARPLGWGAEYLPADRRIEWNTSNVVQYRGRYIWIGLISPFISGDTSGAAYFAVAPLADDFRSFTGAPRQLFGVTQPWESTRFQQGHVFVDGGRLHLIYRSGEGTAESPLAFGLATAEVNL